MQEMRNKFNKKMKMLDSFSFVPFIYSFLSLETHGLQTAKHCIKMVSRCICRVKCLFCSVIFSLLSTMQIVYPLFVLCEHNDIKSRNLCQSKYLHFCSPSHEISHVATVYIVSSTFKHTRYVCSEVFEFNWICDVIACHMADNGTVCIPPCKKH